MKPKLNEETLTAYALGELDDDSRAAIEQELANNPEAQEMVEEIRAVSELATAAFSEQVKASETERTLTYEALAGVEPSASEPADNGTVTRFRMGRSALALAAMALICVGIFAALYPSAKTSFRTQLANKFSLGDSMAPNTQGQQAILPNDPRREISALRSHDEADSQSENSSNEMSWWQEFKRNVTGEIQQEPNKVRVDDLVLTYSDSAGTAVDVSDTDAGAPQVESKNVESGEVFFGGAIAVVPGDGGVNASRETITIVAAFPSVAESVAARPSQAVGGGRAELRLGIPGLGGGGFGAGAQGGGGVAGGGFGGGGGDSARNGTTVFKSLPPVAAPQSSGGLQNVEVTGSLNIRNNFYAPEEAIAPAPSRSSFGKDIIAHKAIPPLNQSGPGVPETEPVLGFDFQDQLNEQVIAPAPSRSSLGKDISPKGAPQSIERELERLEQQLQALAYLDAKNSVSEHKYEERILVADRADAPPVAPVPPAPQVSPGSETYSFIQDNPFIAVSRQPLSTFSIDVDTASYSNMRRFLTQNTRPPKNAVRVEELINYFSYDYAPPEGEDPFSANIEVASSPWNQGTRLVRIGLKGSELTNEERPPTNLVFLIDVSGSMRPANKLPLLQQGLAMLARQMREEDRVAMVVYAGNSGLVLPSTAGNQQSAILGALERLNAGGSTNGGAGIELAYNTAVQNFIPGGVNRVVLATDGDFNVGITDRNALVNLIEAKAKSGVFLSVLGFGMGNLQDDNLEGLANKGNGNYAYIDTLREARKVLVEEMAGTLVTIAKDVKIQVEFNPAQVKAYRLVGYENRLLAARDFNDDAKDAGEIGAGHTVTALYEIVSKDGAFPTAGVDALKYQTPQPAKTEIVEDQGDGELLTVKLRYKQPEGNTSKLLEFPVMDEGAMLGQASTDFRFATSVAGFGMLLRNGTSDAQGLNFEAIRSLAQSALGEDRHGYRAEFLSLVDQARQLITPQQYVTGAVILKGIYVTDVGASVQLLTPQGDLSLDQGAQGGGYQILSIDTGAGCVDVLNLSTGQRSRICI